MSRIAASSLALSLMLQLCMQTSQAGDISVLPGSSAQTQSKLVCTSMKWHTSLEEAKQLAAKEHKLIVWVHMLGNIDGFT